MKRIDNKVVLEKISESVLLKAGFEYFGRYNNGSSNPYHNINHTFRMMQLVIEVLESGLYSSGYGIKEDRLLLFAMFHDFGHSGGRLEDSDNVRISLLHLKNFLGTQGDIVSLEDREILEDTIYPYSDEPKTIEGKILRECDCLQWVFDDFFTQAIFGLKDELRVADYHDAVKKYSEFVKDVLIPELTIPSLKEIAGEYYPEFLDTINKIIK